MEKRCLTPSDSVNTIEASIQIVKRKWRRKKRCDTQAIRPISSSKSDQICLHTARPVSSLKSMVSNSNSSGVKILSAPVLTQKNRKAITVKASIGKKALEKYSSLLFSEDSSMSIPETQILNRTLDFNSSASEATLSDTFMCEYEERLNNSQVQLQSEVEKDWEHLSQQISPRNSQQHISPMEFQCQSEATFDNGFHSTAHGSNFELSPSDYHSTGTDRQCFFNDLKHSVNERLLTQNGLECYVREKMEAAEDYVKQKLTKIEETNWTIVKALNDMKHVEPLLSQRVRPTLTQRDKDSTRTQRHKECVRSHQQVQQLRSTEEFVMPTIPISRGFTLAILNSALKRADYMEQFVSEASRLVTSNGYNGRKLVRSIMTELFTIDLLVKYRWSARTSSSSNKPTFSSLTNVLTAINCLLSNYMSGHNVRREIKDFLKEMI